MGDKSGISWTNDDEGHPGATWNPLLGCEKVSDGCKNCYAIRVSAQMQPGMRMANAAYTGLVKTFPDGSHNWTGEVRMLPERLGQPSKWKSPRRIFVNSMSDLFHKDVTLEFIRDVFVEMGSNPQHTFLVLTKRPERAQDLIRNHYFEQSVIERIVVRSEDDAQVALRKGRRASIIEPHWPLPNVHLGTSVESSDVEYRIDALLGTPAAVRFLSIEPLLGPINLRNYIKPLIRIPASEASAAALESGATEFFRNPNGIHWVITGGESGGEPQRRLVERCTLCTPKSRAVCSQAGQWEEGPCTGWTPRPYCLEWIEDIRDTCLAGGVAYFHKQWGGFTPHSAGHLIRGVAYQQYPTPFRIPAVGIPTEAY